MQAVNRLAPSPLALSASHATICRVLAESASQVNNALRRRHLDERTLYRGVPRAYRSALPAHVVLTACKEISVCDDVEIVPPVPSKQTGWSRP
jgi:hypothetical protein